jgi:transcriptional regulator with XRE-family HTH domain
MSNSDHPHRCRSCGAGLARDNDSALCRPCETTRRAQASIARGVPASFWENEELRAALAAHHMGHVIRAYRQHPYHGRRGLAQDFIAARAGVTQGQLSRIETGSPMLALDRLIFWAQLLDIPQDYLWFKLPTADNSSDRPVPQQPGGDIVRAWREIGRSVSSRPTAGATWFGWGTSTVGTGHLVEDETSLTAERAAALGPDLWALHDVLQATTVSRTSLALAEEACARLDARYAELSPSVLLPELRSQLHHIVGWLRQPQPIAYRQRLCSLAGRLAGLRAWLYFDMADHGAADAWFGAAVSAAREADDHDLCGYLLGAQSLIPTDRQDHRAAARLIEDAQAALGRAGSPTTRAWLDMLDARALAGTRDSRGFAAAHQRAAKRLQRTCLDDRRHGMDFVGDRLDVAYYAGLSHLLLHDPVSATESFQAALDSLPASRVKARAILLLSLAMAAAQDCRPEEAAARAGEALTIADNQPIGRVWRRVEEVRRAVGTAARTVAVRELDDHMVEFAGSLERANPGPLP